MHTPPKTERRTETGTADAAMMKTAAADTIMGPDMTAGADTEPFKERYDMAEEVRIDKYLWAIRAFKTRSEATDACKGGKIRLNGSDIKPSRPVREGDVLNVRKGPVCYTYKVISPIDKRQGAKNVHLYAENITPQEELDKLRHPVETFFLRRDPGAGRPTKRDRRQMDMLWGSLSMDVPDDVAESIAAGFGFEDADDDFFDED